MMKGTTANKSIIVKSLLGRESWLAVGLGKTSGSKPKPKPKPKRQLRFMISSLRAWALRQRFTTSLPPPLIRRILDCKSQQPSNVISATGTRGWDCDWLADCVKWELSLSLESRLWSVCEVTEVWSVKCESARKEEKSLMVQARPPSRSPSPWRCDCEPGALLVKG